ncbi:MAG: GNAT family N-acetyltransferase [Pseudomonadota bacterium]
MDDRAENPLVKSIAVATDLMVMDGLSEVEHHADRVILRTPSEPDYWYGNMVIFRGADVRPDLQIAQFRADFPDAAHVTLGWDVPHMTHGTGHSILASLGFGIDATDVLTRKGPGLNAPTPPGITLRPIADEADWDRVLRLQIDTGVEAGYPRLQHIGFVKRRFANLRKKTAQGRGQWFGAFDGALLVGDLGIFVQDGLARYQSVETRDSHRRRGICAALVAKAANWALESAPDTTLVIVAVQDGAAGRIYRRCGFRPTETTVSAVKGSY